MLVEFFVPGLPGDGSDEHDIAVAQIALSADVLTEGGGVERQEIVFPIGTRLSAAGHAEPEVRREMLLLDAAKAREDALRMRDEGDLGGAASTLRIMSLRMAMAPQDLGDEFAAELQEQAVDLADVAQQFARSDVKEADAKYLAQRAYNAHRSKRAYEAKLSRRKD